MTEISSIKRLILSDPRCTILILNEYLRSLNDLSRGSSVPIIPYIPKKVNRLTENTENGRGRSRFGLFSAAFVEGRVAGVEIFAVQMLLRAAEGIGNTVNMKH